MAGEASASGSNPTLIGRYAIFDEIASGGMAAVHYGRLLGPSGFSRTVAIKKLHPHLVKDGDFSAMLLDEARVAARVRHPNVVATLDIVSTDEQLFLVLEYVHGESLSRLSRAGKKANLPMPPSVAAAVMVGILHGLHAAHEATDERGVALNIVHRDISPQNILVGLDGIPRLADFGVAKAAGRVQTTREGQLKGKIAYMAPEQIKGAQPTRLMDVYAASVVFWEILTGERLFGGDNDVIVLERALNHVADAPSKHNAAVPAALDAVVLRGLERDPAKRFQTAKEMAREIENVTQVASVSKISEWVEAIAGEVIAERAAKVAEIESQSQIRPAMLSKSSETIDIPIVMSSERPPPIRTKRWPFIAAAAAVACVSLVAGMALRRHADSTPPPKAAATTAAPLVSAMPTIEPATPLPTATATSVESVAVVPPVTPPPKNTAAATATSKIVREFPTGKNVKPGCNPPYTIDSHGVKQYKMECL